MASVVFDPPAPLSGVDEWAGQALTELATLPGVGRVGLALVEGGGRRLLFTASDRRAGPELDWCHIDAFSAVPLNDAIGSGLVVAGRLDGLDGRYDTFVTAQREAGHTGVAAVPLCVADHALGGFVLYYDQDHAVTSPDELTVVADRLAARLRSALRGPGSLSVGELEAPDGSLVAQEQLAPDISAVGDARRFLESTLAAWGVGHETTDRAVLCLSELVTNALIHTTGGCVVQVSLHDGVLTTRVHDNGTSAAPRVDAPSGSVRGHGHGLHVVDTIAGRWGRTVEPDSAAVWFDLDVTP